MTWSQLQIHSKPVGLLDVAGYWQPLRRLVDHAVDQGFVAPDSRELLVWSDDATELLAALGEWRARRAS